MKLKRFLALLLAAALLGGLPALAAADEAPLPEDEFALSEASEYGDIAIIDDTIGTVQTESTAAPSLRRRGGTPTSYDPREDGGFLPPVRTQGAWNTCWVVAAVGAAETDGLKRGLLTTSAPETDLSERHLLYFFSHQADDPLGNSSQDYNISPSFWIQSGGNPVIATMTLANWHGAADEAATNSPYGGLRTDDNLDAAFAYTDELHLENTYTVDISTDSGRGALKALILEHGGAVLCMYYSASYLFAGSPSAQIEDPDPADDPILDGTDGTVAEEDAAEELPTDAAAAEDAEPEAIAEGPEEPLPEAPEDPPADDPSEPVPAAESEPPEETGGTDVPENVPEPETSAVQAEPAGETAGLDGAPDAEGEDGADGDEPKADDFTVCYYQDAATTTNHEVLVVGWDDDYPRENFAFSAAVSQAISAYMEEANTDLEEGEEPMDYATARENFIPAENGAWLCRNSHGGSWYGGDGYFWVSYYDVCVSAATNGAITGRAVAFEFASPDNFDNNYEYDGAAVLGYVNDTVDGKGVSTLNANPDSQRWYANVFTVGGNDEPRGTELLRAVSTYTYRPNVAYTAQVYTGLADPSDPASGTLAAEISGSFPLAGYHTVALPDAVPLTEGDVFSVVFRVGSASDNSLLVPSCHTSSSWHSTNETLTGQSFVSLTGSGWIDCIGLRNTPNVRIKAFTDDVAAVFPFTDVSESAWYYDDVETSWLKYLVNGTSATTYEPALNATRAQVVTVLWRLAGEPAPDDASTFPDVAGDIWYADAIAWAQENGVVTGHTDGLFRPNLAVTRQEFIAILYRYAQLCGLDTSAQASIASCPDAASVGVWARQAVRWSFAAGVMQGVEAADGTVSISPLANVTRAQLAAFLNRFSDMLP